MPDTLVILLLIAVLSVVAGAWAGATVVGRRLQRIEARSMAAANQTAARVTSSKPIARAWPPFSRVWSKGCSSWMEMAGCVS